ncbi:DNA alkylation repair protein [Galactobacter valiniphilus]|uniref:DNA alkylation repair protein n=1 Tax=Galactobacter valiniphilus TaxID=2676122 RepID=A0A399JB92_9MICC|nr:DNA alkylation repair protein [Galactobacter valiniphilus]RII42484.1 DNA alkylation repair protein [Galactobacter valiniphilus]
MPMADELLGAPQAAAFHAALSAASGRELPGLRAAAAPEALTPLALSARASALAEAALAELPGDFASVAGSLRVAAQDPAFEGWLIWPAGLTAARSALKAGDEGSFDEAMEILALLTPRNTSEFAIRELLRARPERGIEIMRGWVGHPHHHVRRLASEGSRPLLPWGLRVPALVKDPGLAAPILEALRGDPQDYVYRSVANHLNDHSRHHPQWVLSTAEAWAAAPRGNGEWVIKHGLRTLIKRGEPGALRLLGFSSEDLGVEGPVVATPEVPFGGELRFEGSVANRGAAPARVAIDWALHLRGARGAARRKVFKLAAPTLAPGERLDIERAFSFRPITTRAYYPGEHAVELLVNGTSHGPVPFELLEP